MSVYLPLSPIFLTVWVYLLLSVYRSRCVCSVLYSQVALQISRVYLCRYLILHTSHLLFIAPLSFSISVSFCFLSTSISHFSLSLSSILSLSVSVSVFISHSFSSAFNSLHAGLPAGFPFISRPYLQKCQGHNPFILSRSLPISIFTCPYLPHLTLASLSTSCSLSLCLVTTGSPFISVHKKLPGHDRSSGLPE